MSSASFSSDTSLSSGMSESESRYLVQVREMLQAAARGDIPFGLAMASLLSDLRVIRERDWDVAAIGSSTTPSAVAYSIRANSVSRHIAPSAAHRELLDDMDGLIDHSVKNGISFLPLAAALGHDASGLANYEWSLEKARADFFLPKSTGWAKRNREPIGEAEGIMG